MRHTKVHPQFMVRVGFFATKTEQLRVSYRWNGGIAVKYGDLWFWLQHDVDGNPFIEPDRPIPSGNYQPFDKEAA